MDASLSPGLYIVATPIGNLGDITLRAIATLRGVAAVACEDTRVTGKLLHHLEIKQRLIRYDDHASDATRDYILALAAEQPVALVSDAGTPLISDPGFKLVRAARESGIAVTSLPGPSAAIMALTLAGLPSDRFLFAGFPPPARAARMRFLEDLRDVQATLVLYDSPKRVAALLVDAAAALGGGRQAAVCRELTKRFEEVRRGTLAELAEEFAAEEVRGEIVVVIDRGTATVADAATWEEALDRAMETLSVKDAAAMVAEAYGLPRRDVYQVALGRGKGR